MIDNPGGGKKKKDDGNYYAEHIYASPSEPSSPLAGSQEFTTAYYPFALTPRYDYFVIPVLSLSLSFLPQKFTTTILLNHDLVYAIPSINSWSEAFVQSSKSPPHLPNKMNINRRADLSSCAHVMHSVMACRWKFISSPSHATLERSPVSPTIRIKRCDSLQLILRKGRSRKSLGNSVPG